MQGELGGECFTGYLTAARADPGTRTILAQALLNVEQGGWGTDLDFDRSHMAEPRPPGWPYKWDQCRLRQVRLHHRKDIKHGF